MDSRPDTTAGFDVDCTQPRYFPNKAGGKGRMLVQLDRGQAQGLGTGGPQVEQGEGAVTEDKDKPIIQPDEDYEPVPTPTADDVPTVEEEGS